MSQISKARAYIGKHPNATNKKVSEAVGCSTWTAAKARKTLTQTRRRVKSAPSGIKLTVSSPVIVQLQENGSLIGTVTVSHTGVSYRPAKAKLEPQLVPWGVVEMAAHLQK